MSRFGGFFQRRAGKSFFMDQALAQLRTEYRLSLGIDPKNLTFKITD